MAWVAAFLGPRRYLVFTCTDRSGAPTARGVPIAGDEPTPDEVRAAVESPPATVHLAGVTTRELPPAWLARLGLPEVPPWAAPREARPWREHALLRGHFHPAHPDDIEATFVLLAHTTLEKLWVRLEDEVPGVGFRGELIVASELDPGLAAGTKVVVRPSASHPPMLWVPDEATADNLERFTCACEACGFDMVFIPIDALARLQFPDAPDDAQIERFATPCILCKGTMHIQRNPA